jgi:predicted ATPase
MIHKVEIVDPSDTIIKWLGKVPALQAPRTFEFSPGLNVLWGRNGSGKSTLLTLLARMFHCHQSGEPSVTDGSIRELFGYRDGEERLLKSVKVSHDGQGVRHFDPMLMPGLIAGGAAFDGDFMMEGVNNALFKGSAGQTTAFRANKVLGAIVKTTVGPQVEWKFHRRESNDPKDLWAQRQKMVEKVLEANAAAGPMTVLLDEPERSFDLPTQVTLWRLLRAYSSRVQIIAASHCVFALNIPEARYIEMEPGYLDASKASVGLLSTWSGERPFPKTPQPEEDKGKKASKKTPKGAPKAKRTGLRQRA